jgi:two-component sensor histidine kinase
MLALVQETDHRVKKTIQSIASLLMLQARSCAAPDARSALEGAARRLGVFSRVHELLHSNGAGDRTVDLADVMHALAQALRATFSDRLTLRVVADHVMVESRLAIPLSLLVNEAITNAFKHAYPNGKTGEIFVRVAKTTNGGLRIGIQDDGIGLSTDVPEGSLGLTLMRTFASQLGSHLTVLSDEGTTIQLTVLNGAASRPNGHLTEGQVT